MSEKIKEFAEVPQQFIKEGTHVSRLYTAWQVKYGSF